MSASPSSRKLVVAALLTTVDSRVLITQRRTDQPPGLQWELPGGKIEPGESPERALLRELHEEIGVEVHIGRVWDVLYHDYGPYEVVMLVYHCWLAPGQTVQALDVQDFAWCRPQELPGYDILPADRPLIERLLSEGPPLIPA